MKTKGKRLLALTVELPKYPIFVPEPPGVFVSFDSEADVLRLEDQDIDDAYYHGWDSDGCPVEIRWDRNPRAQRTSNKPELHKLKQEIVRFGKMNSLRGSFEATDPDESAQSLFLRAYQHYWGYPPS